MLKNFLDKFNKYQEQQKALRELNAMSDKELADIGITRGMIPFVVKGL